jgi:hypothetical protein
MCIRAPRFDGPGSSRIASRPAWNVRNPPANLRLEVEARQVVNSIVCVLQDDGVSVETQQPIQAVLRQPNHRSPAGMASGAGSARVAGDRTHL